MANMDITTKIYKELFKSEEDHQSINDEVRAVIINFGDERGDIIVENDNFGTKRKYADFTEGKKKVGLHPMQIVFSGLEDAIYFDLKYIGRDEQIHSFREFVSKKKETVKMYYVANHETGDMIEEVRSVKEGESLIDYFEESDKLEGIYKPDFYCVMVKDIYYIQHTYKLSIKQLSDRFDIPYRTVQNWVGGLRKCPVYIIKMMLEILEK